MNFKWLIFSALCFTIGISHPAFSTDLQPGDVAIIGVNASTSSADKFAFIFTVDITSGTEILITDNGWKSNSSFRSGEGILTWTATGDETAGTIVTLTESSGTWSSSGGHTVSKSGSFTIASGDQLLIYQNSSDFIYGLQMRNGWDADATSSTTSSLPSLLTNNLTALSLSSSQNDAFYNVSTTSGYQKEVLLDINDLSNWTTGSSSWPSWSFIIDACDEPTGSPSLGSPVLSASSITLNWSLGSESDNTLILVNSSNSFSDPTDREEFSSSSIWSESGEMTMYTGTGTSATIYNLNAETTYSFALYGLNECGGWPNYYLTSTIQNYSTTTCGQNILVSQGFETNDPWTYSVTSGAGAVSSTNTNEENGTGTERINSGSNSFQNTNSTTILEFESVKLLNYKDYQVQLHCAAIGTSATLGIDNTDYIKVYLSEDGSFPGSPNYTISGATSSSNSKWGMSGTGVLYCDATETKSYLYSGSTTKTDTSAKSLVVIDIPDSWTDVYLKIEMSTNSTTEIFCIDDVQLIGSCPSNNSTYDNFNRTTSNTVGTPSSGGSSWIESEYSSGSAAIGGYKKLKLTTPISQSGHTYVYTDISTLYSSKFGYAEDSLTWSFNMYQTETDPSGLTSGSYGVAVILGCDNSDFTASDAKGYAVVLGQTGSTDPVRLVKFSDGIDGGVSSLTDLITTGDFDNDALLVMVSYSPCSQKWRLKVESEGVLENGFERNYLFGNPKSLNMGGGAVEDDTYVTTELTYFGLIWSHNSTVSNTDKFALFDNVSLPNQIENAVTYAWTGDFDDDFTNSGNWSPERTCIKKNDILTYSEGGSATITNVESSDLGFLSVTNNSTLTIIGATGTQRLIISGIDGNDDLEVEAGSTLHLDGNNPIEIELASGTTGYIDGTLLIEYTSGATNSAFRIIVNDANALTVSGTINAVDLSGSLFDGSADEAVVFETGSEYIAESGSSPFGSSSESLAVFNSGSTYTHKLSTAPSLAGRTFANLQIDYTGTVNIYNGSSSSSVTLDDLTIKTGTTLNVTYQTNDLPLHWSIKGDLTVESSASLLFDPEITDASSTISFNGSDNQIIDNAGTLTFGQFTTMEFNNSSDITLNSDLTTTGELLFTLGHLELNGFDFTFDNSSNPEGYSDSYIRTNNGGKFIRKIKNTSTDYLFPIGQNPYLPIIFNVSSTGPGSTLITEVSVYDNILIDPTDALSDDLGTAGYLNYVSKTWEIQTDHSSGIVPADITLQWPTAAQSTVPSDPNNTALGYWENGVNTTWNSGILSASDEPLTDIYTQTRTINLNSSGGTGTLYYLGIGSNSSPLPVELSDFWIDCTSGTTPSVVHWTTASELNAAFYVLEASINGVDFNEIATIPSRNNRIFEEEYSHNIDIEPNTRYVRLKQFDLNGEAHIAALGSLEKCNPSSQIDLVYANDGQFVGLICNLDLNLSIEIFSSTGAVLDEFNMQTVGNQITDLRNRFSSNGIFFLRINGQVHKVKI